MPYGWEGFADRLTGNILAGYQIGRRGREREEDIAREELAARAMRNRQASEAQERAVERGREENQRAFERRLALEKLPLEKRLMEAEIERRGRMPAEREEASVAAKLSGIASAQAQIDQAAKERGRRWYKPEFWERPQYSDTEKELKARLTSRAMGLLGVDRADSGQDYGGLVEVENPQTGERRSVPDSDLLRQRLASGALRRVGAPGR
jgi:hypothetical protein